MLRKRGDAGPRGSWTFNISDKSISPESKNSADDLKIVAVRPEARKAENMGHGRSSSTPTAAAGLQTQLSLSGSQGRKSRGSPDPFEAVDHAMEAAATQLVNKALRFISLDTSPPRAESVPPVPMPLAPGSTASPHAKFDSTSLIDKSIDAISGVGKMVEDLAVTLDEVIGQAFDDWVPQKAPGREGKRRMSRPLGSAPVAPSVGSNTTQQPKAGTLRSPKDEWGDFDVEEGGSREAAHSKDYVPPAPAVPAVPARGESAKQIQQWRRRAQILQRELQKLRAQRDEYERLKEQLRKEAEQGEPLTPQAMAANQPGSGKTPSTDHLANEQVTRQVETLLAEKARLAQENDRLLRENSGLHELLEFTMQQHAAQIGDDELFGEGSEPSYEDDSGAEWGWEPVEREPDF